MNPKKLELEEQPILEATANETINDVIEIRKEAVCAGAPTESMVTEDKLDSIERALEEAEEMAKNFELDVNNLNVYAESLRVEDQNSLEKSPNFEEGSVGGSIEGDIKDDEVKPEEDASDLISRSSMYQTCIEPNSAVEASPLFKESA